MKGLQSSSLLVSDDMSITARAYQLVVEGRGRSCTFPIYRDWLSVGVPSDNWPLIYLNLPYGACRLWVQGEEVRPVRAHSMASVLTLFSRVEWNPYISMIFKCVSSPLQGNMGWTENPECYWQPAGLVLSRHRQRADRRPMKCTLFKGPWSTLMICKACT